MVHHVGCVSLLGGGVYQQGPYSHGTYSWCHVPEVLIAESYSWVLIRRVLFARALFTGVLFVRFHCTSKAYGVEPKSFSLFPNERRSKLPQRVTVSNPYIVEAHWVQEAMGGGRLPRLCEPREQKGASIRRFDLRL